MDIRRRMINTPPPSADNMFVIDDITFEEVNMWGAIGYYSKTENLNTMNSLKNFFVENGDYENETYELDPSKIELYLYDYKIPVNRLCYDVQNDLVSIGSSEGVFPGNLSGIRRDNTIENHSGNTVDGEWTFDYIPTTSVEAILFVEFAKQYGIDAIKIDGYNVIFDEGGDMLYIEPKGWITHSYTVYGANNGDLTGHIQYFEGEGSGEFND